jgi:hypothetical protein
MVVAFQFEGLSPPGMTKTCLHLYQLTILAGKTVKGAPSAAATMTLLPLRPQTMPAREGLQTLKSPSIARTVHVQAFSKR